MYSTACFFKFKIRTQKKIIKVRNFENCVKLIFTDVYYIESFKTIFLVLLKLFFIIFDNSHPRILLSCYVGLTAVCVQVIGSGTRSRTSPPPSHPSNSSSCVAPASHVSCATILRACGPWRDGRSEPRRQPQSKSWAWALVVAN